MTTAETRTPPEPEDAEEARCPECNMPLSMHHDPMCSQPCGRCEARKARITEQYVLQVRVTGNEGWDDVGSGDWADSGARRVALWACAQKALPLTEYRIVRRTEEVLEG